jgi:hypothetical protein
MGKRAEPLFDNVKGQRLPAVLVRIDVAMPAGKVAAGQDMKEDVDGSF